MRNYKRKTDHKPITNAALDQARLLIKRGSSIRQAAKTVGVCTSTLGDALKRGKVAEKLGRFQAVFSKEQDDEIVKHCVKLDKRFFGLTFESLRLLLCDFAYRNNVKHPFSNHLAGKDFTRRFMKRNKISLRDQRKKGATITTGLNRSQIKQHFDNLETLVKRYGFTSESMYSMAETAPGKLPKNVAPTGKMEVAKFVADDKWHTVSVACVVSATGHYVPPFFIFARPWLDNFLIEDIPDVCNMAVTDKGHMDSPTFIKWLEYFKDFVNPSQERPILLILDNRVAHVSLETILTAETNHIHILSLPPHSSYKTQPLNRHLFGPLKKYYDSAVADWNVCHPGQEPSVYDVAESFKLAFEQAATTESAIQGFRATGIYPVNRDVFTEADFLRAVGTDECTGREEDIDEHEPRFLVVFGDKNNLSEAGDSRELSEGPSTSGSSTLAQVSEQDPYDAKPSTSQLSDKNPKAPRSKKMKKEL